MEGTTVNVSAETTTYDFTNAMTAGGYYTVTVRAKTDGPIYMDGAVSKSSSENLNPVGLKPTIFIKNLNEVPIPPTNLGNTDQKGFGFVLGPYTYWAYDFVENDFKVAIVAYNLAGEIVKQWVFNDGGIRYVNGISADEINQTISITTKQSGSGKPGTITKQWSDFFIQVPSR